MRVVYRAFKFIAYLLQAKSKYYLHSPFVYQFYLHVLEGKADEHTEQIAIFRKSLRANTSCVQVNDFGTGSSAVKRVSDIEKSICIRHRYGLLLYRLAKHFQPGYILEIGSSIGISSSYLASAVPAATVFSLEGSTALVQIAEENYRNLQMDNVHLVEGDFTDTLPDILPQLPSLDLVFFDGNHTLQATLNYFNQCLKFSDEQSIFVFDDIYWSSEMTEAWELIRQHPSVTLSIDVYQFGICFFRKDKLAKEHFVLLY